MFELHGWNDLHPKLNAMSKEGKWEEMGTAIDDDVLDAFAVVATPDKVAEGLLGRYGDILDRLSFYAPYQGDQDVWAQVVADLKKGLAPSASNEHRWLVHAGASCCFADSSRPRRAGEE